MNFSSCDPSSRIVVLLVDDDRNDQALFSLAVDQAGAPLWVHGVLDGQQAIDYLEGAENFGDRVLHPIPDILLLDLKMQIGDGFDFLRWRKNHPLYSMLPVILFTGSQFQADIQRALKLGATCHICKPSSFKDLLGAVNQITDLARELGPQKR